MERGNFRLHPPGPLGISYGCITLQHRSDFMAIRQALMSTRQTELPNGLMELWNDRGDPEWAGVV